MKRNIIVTEDGSHTFYLPEFDESFHSKHGAIQESKHVYIDAALKPVLALFSEINVLEIGFGTGLNAFLTLLELENHPSKTIFYSGIEAFPMTDAEVKMINYPKLLQSGRMEFDVLHQLSWNKDYAAVEPQFFLKKTHALLQEVHLPKNNFQVVYFDAFAPSVQPELWSREIFEKIYRSMSVSGIMTTYSCKGAVRRILQEIGFFVERIPAPAGKREMLRARKVVNT